MATNEGVLNAWRVLESAGLQRPSSTPDATHRSIQVWAVVLADLTDKRLLELTIAWLRSPESKYGRWPTPGAILDALPDPATADDSEEAWGEALQLLAMFGRSKAPEDTDALENLRSQLRAAYALAKEKRDQRRMFRLQRFGERLPRSDRDRTDALFAAVRACGGFHRLGNAEDGDMVAHRASFRAAYKAARSRKKLAASEQTIAALTSGRFKLLSGDKD